MVLRNLYNSFKVSMKFVQILSEFCRTIALQLHLFIDRLGGKNHYLLVLMVYIGIFGVCMTNIRILYILRLLGLFFSVAQYACRFNFNANQLQEIYFGEDVRKCFLYSVLVLGLSPMLA